MKEAGEREITVKFNGKEIDMVPFVEDILKGSIVGMTSALKGYEEDCRVEIIIE